MKKYLTAMYLSILQLFTYRLSFILWRVRNIFNLIFIYFLWTSVFVHRPSIFSYTQDKLVSYILLITLLSSLILSTRTIDVGADIVSGDIMNYLLKPFSFFKFVIGRDIADKVVNILFSVGEILILLLILNPRLFIQKDLVSYLLFFFSLSIGGIIAFLISLDLSFLAFWSSEIWAPRYIYSILLWFLAGSFFPLDILPKVVYSILLLTPFPYLIFLPSKIFLNGFSTALLIPISLSLAWCVILYFMTKKIWEKGIKNYSAYGR